MNANELLALYDQEQRIEIEHPEVEKTIDSGVVRFVRPAPGMSYISYSRLDPATMDVVIQEQIAFFSQIDQPFSWHVYDHDTPLDLKTQLVRHGFTPDDDPDAVMVLDVQDASPTLLKPVEDTVRRIAERNQLDDVARIESEVWGGEFAWLKQRLGDHMAIQDYLSVYVSYVDEQPACSGWIYFYPNSQFANLFGGATVTTHRNLGLYTAVLAIRVQEAIKRGYRFLTTGASPMSQPVLAKNGFRLLTRAYAYEWQGTTA